MNWQPVLQGRLMRLVPMLPEHFEPLYAAASDPRIWEQHPEPTRWQRKVFTKYFESGLACHGALVATELATGRLIGSSRFYDRNENDGFVHMGYTFLTADHWGGGWNRELKSLMLGHAFRFVENVFFQVGANNIRSQKAMLKIGAQRVPRDDAYGHVYRISKSDWFGKAAEL